MSESSAAEMLTGGQEAPAPEVPADNSAPWYGEVDTDMQGYIGNKGWKEPRQVIEGYRNLEKLFGSDRAGRTVVLPKEDEDKSEFFNKLGRPENPDGYKFDVDSNDTVEWFRGKAHELGLSQDQAASLMKEWEAYSGNVMNEQEETSKVEYTNQMADLKREWGSAYDLKMSEAKRAASQFEFTADEIDAIEKVLGPKALYNRFAQMGRALGEDKFEGGGTGNSFILSPAEAQGQIAELMLDDSFKSKYMSGDVHAKQKMEKLYKAAYPS